MSEMPREVLAICQGCGAHVDRADLIEWEESRTYGHTKDVDCGDGVRLPEICGPVDVYVPWATVDALIAAVRDYKRGWCAMGGIHGAARKYYRRVWTARRFKMLRALDTYDAAMGGER